MVLFFDIDGTLLHTTGCGMASILEAGRELHGPMFTLDGIPVAGRLDPLIFSDAFQRNNIPDTPEHHAAMRRAYVPKLTARLQSTTTATALPGVHKLLDALAYAHAQSQVTLSLLTGNIEEAGTLKLRRCGIDPARFAFGVWGDDGPPLPKREDLVPVGMRRADRFRSRTHAHTEFIVIGDTPHDVRCAKVHGGRCLAVATGQFSLEQLQEAGADLVVPTLEATDDLVAWLTRP